MTLRPALWLTLTGQPYTLPLTVPNSGQPDAAAKPEQIVSPSVEAGVSDETDDAQEVRRLKRERAKLIPVQHGSPANRQKLRALTIDQLRLEVGA